MLLRVSSIVAGLMLLAACASAPKGVADGPSHLALCDGISVSNAPATDAYRRVVGYTPFARIRGKLIARTPVEGCLSSAFGPRRGGAGAFHEGVDLYTGSPAPVAAAGDGLVRLSASLRGYGRTIEIDHGDGVVTRYAHLSRAAVRTGAKVRAGELIGETGRTGNATAVHLHYEILVDGRPLDPLRVDGRGV